VQFHGLAPRRSPCRSLLSSRRRSPND
jgi:hypothetical protein